MPDMRDFAVGSLDEASEALATAAALGMNVPAPEGTVIYTVSTVRSWGNSARSETLTGAYLSEEDARNALAAWILEDWKEILYMPWESRTAWRRDVETFAENFNAWVASHTVDDVLLEWEATGTYTMDRKPVTLHRNPCGKDQ